MTTDSPFRSDTECPQELQIRQTFAARAYKRPDITVRVEDWITESPYYQEHIETCPNCNGQVLAEQYDAVSHGTLVKSEEPAPYRISEMEAAR